MDAEIVVVGIAENLEGRVGGGEKPAVLAGTGIGSVAHGVGKRYSRGHAGRVGPTEHHLRSEVREVVLGRRESDLLAGRWVAGRDEVGPRVVVDGRMRHRADDAEA